ncbi:dTDP-4-amino-4,6-dideoxygalactose transaminase [Candidatus Sumerlaeota bacterium]|nr:dTDP-4-amino-4,6-dideoxygalactose transaminase [Candidatus Sumerlaeota bacterium]
MTHAAAPYRVPFNRACFEGNEIGYIEEAIRNGHISGDGPFTRRCHEILEKQTGALRAYLTCSCTHALEMAAILLDLEPDDEVVLPSFTFVSTANAFVLRGARPVFADIRPDTLNLDETRLESLLTPRTRAIVPVHYAGVGCEMDAILDLARRRNVAVVEDNAHGLFASYKGRRLGTFGCMATQSFHETKNVTCGEGGALLVNDPALIDRAEIVRQKGTNRNRYYRGEVDKYTWVDVGSSFVPSDLLAAFLCAQLEAVDRIQAHRRRIWDFYRENLSDWAAARGATLPTVPSHCEQSYHMFYLLLASREERTALIAHLKERGILAVFHYQPLHLSEMGMRFGGQAGDCPVTEDVADRLLRLPFFNELSRDDQEYVVRSIREF